MSKPTGPVRGERTRAAATLIFNLSGYEVIDAVDPPLGGRRVTVRAVVRDDSCPGCGVIATRVHAWVRQRVKDIPTGGEPIEVVVRKPRMLCPEPSCSRRTFTQVTEQLPAGARCLTRLRDQVVHAVIDSGRAVDQVAASFGLAWWTVQSAVNTAAVTLPDPDMAPVRHLGVDEHRFRSARFFRDCDTDTWTRVEPWMSTFVNADTGQVLGVVDGQGGPGVREWIEARTNIWRARVEVVAIDPSTPFRSAIRQALPHAPVVGGPLASGAPGEPDRDPGAPTRGP